MLKNNRLWVFGDSYTNDLDTADWIWTRQLAEKFQVAESLNCSLPGSANDWILHNLEKRIPEFKSGDYVLVVLTSIYRQWFVESVPQAGNYQELVWEKSQFSVDKRAQEAMEMYKVYLQRDSLDLQRFKHQMAWLSLTAMKYKDVKFILIPAFPHSVFDLTEYGLMKTEGSLSDISYGEFVSDKETNMWYSLGIDPKISHMIRDNHDILADRVYSAVENNTVLDLKTGFHKEFLSSKHFKQVERVPGVRIANLK